MEKRIGGGPDFTRIEQRIYEPGERLFVAFNSGKEDERIVVDLAEVAFDIDNVIVGTTIDGDIIKVTQDMDPAVYHAQDRRLMDAVGVTEDVLKLYEARVITEASP